MKKLLCVNISILLILLSVLGGCSEPIEVDEDSIYNFISYENEDVFDIEQIDLPYSLSRSCVSYKFNYLSDGYKIIGFISIPKSVIETQSQGKCILYNRGGNSKIGLLDDEDTAKICVATNRIVIASQYRGAYGCEGIDEFGGSDLNDVIKLVDLCESQFLFVDMNDFCVAGVSRGGMMSYMLSRYDDRVKKLIAVSAVSDLFQSYEEREDMQNLLFNYIGTTPEDNRGEYERRSAIYWADEITVPVLIIHSKYDAQVSFSQAQAFCDKLKLTNENVTFVARDDSLHGLSRKDYDEIKEFLNN